jgi:hypothetical protein
MNPLAVIQAHLTELLAFGARRIGVFGSFARAEARGDSDVDVYVEFDDAKRTYDNFFALHASRNSDAADFLHHLPTGSRRYGRLETCATSWERGGKEVSYACGPHGCVLRTDD